MRQSDFYLVYEAYNLLKPIKLPVARTIKTPTITITQPKDFKND